MADEDFGTITLAQLLILEEKHNYVPEGIDLQKWKELDATCDPPYCEEEPDGSLQFYNCKTGRPCRKLCDFEKDFLQGFYQYTKPGFPMLPFKDLECWRNQLSTPCLKLWENYVRDHQTPAQKEERDESIRNWLSMMHDTYWHKEQGCTCRQHLHQHARERREEPTLAEIIESVKIGRPRRKSAKNDDTPTTPSKSIKKEPVSPSSARKGKEKIRVKNEEDSDVDFEPPKKYVRKAPKKKTAADDTRTGKSVKRKTPAKVPSTLDIAEETPNKKLKPTTSLMVTLNIAKASREAPVQRPSSNANLIAEHPDIIEELVADTVKRMHEEVITLNKTPKEVIESWTGLVVTSTEPPLKRPSQRAHKQTPTHAPKKRAAASGKKGVKAKKVDDDDDDDDMLAAKNPDPEPFGGLLYNRLYDPAQDPLYDPHPLEEPNDWPRRPENYDLMGFSLKQRYELEMSMRAAEDIEPNSPIPQTPKPKEFSLEDEKFIVSGMTPNNTYPVAEVTPSRLLKFDGLKIAEEDRKDIVTPNHLNTVAEVTPSRLLKFDGLKIAEEDHQDEQNGMQMALPSNNPSTPAKRKSAVLKPGNDTPTKKSKAPTSRNSKAPAIKKSEISAKKSKAPAMKKKSEISSTKKGEASATKKGETSSTKNDDGTALDATDMISEKEPPVKVEKSSDIMMF